MAKIALNQTKRSRYINKRVFEQPGERVSNAPTWVAAPGFEELVNSFLRNKVQIKYTSAYFDSEETGFEEEEDDEQFMLSLYDFCDQHCTGLWTMHRIYHRNKEFCRVTHTYTHLDTGRGTVTVHFEKEEDVETFLQGYKMPESIN